MDGNAELVINDETGLIVPSGNPQALAEAIERLAGDRQKAEIMGINGRKRVKTLFSFEKMINGYERIYIGFTSAF